jgi:hypothetical protein
MKKYPLLGVSIVAVVLLVLGSFNNIVGYQTVQASNQKIITTEINDKVPNSVLKSSNEYPFKNPPNELWNKTYGGADMYFTAFVQQTKDNGYIMLGADQSYGANFWIVKTDIDGNEVWNKTYSGPYDEWGDCIRETTDEGFIISGAQETSYSTGHFNTSLIKTDSAGNKIWNKTYVRNDSESDGCSVIEVDDGYVVVSTLYYKNNPGSRGIWLVKTDLDGRMLWDTVLDDSAQGNSVIQTKNGDFVVVGTSEFEQVLLIKTDANGAVLWSKTLEGTEGNDIKECDDGGYIIAGKRHVCLVGTDVDGNMLWKKEYQMFESTALSVDLTSDGGYILTGNAASGSTCNMLVIKTDEHGNREWEKIIGGSETTSGNCVIQSNDGTYVIAGTTFRSGLYYARLVKLSPFQNQRPINPLLTGPSTGKPFHKYIYSINATDPEGESLYYWFEWGDGTITSWQGPYESGKMCNTSIHWNKQGTYTINAKAADVYGGDSDWVTLHITMPNNRASFNFNWLSFLERFLHAFPIIRFLMDHK